MVTNDWIKDTGTVFALIFLIPLVSLENTLLLVAFVLLCAVVIAPRILYPLGWFWLHAAKVIMIIGQKLSFSIVFFFIFTPVALIKKFFMVCSKKSHQNTSLTSVFVTREHQYVSVDITKPY